MIPSDDPRWWGVHLFFYLFSLTTKIEEQEQQEVDVFDTLFWYSEQKSLYLFLEKEAKIIHRKINHIIGNKSES